MKFFGKHYKEKNYNKKRLGENNKIINVKGKEQKILATNKKQILEKIFLLLIEITWVTFMSLAIEFKV